VAYILACNTPVVAPVGTCGRWRSHAPGDLPTQYHRRTLWSGTALCIVLGQVQRDVLLHISVTPANSVTARYPLLQTAADTIAYGDWYHTGHSGSSSRTPGSSDILRRRPHFHLGWCISLAWTRTASGLWRVRRRWQSNAPLCWPGTFSFCYHLHAHPLPMGTISHPCKPVYLPFSSCLGAMTYTCHGIEGWLPVATCDSTYDTLPHISSGVFHLWFFVFCHHLLTACFVASSKAHTCLCACGLAGADNCIYIFSLKMVLPYLNIYVWSPWRRSRTCRSDLQSNAISSTLLQRPLRCSIQPSIRRLRWYSTRNARP